MRTLGDKSYKDVEFLPGFFKEGGLIAGSTQRIRVEKVEGNSLNFL